MTGRTVRLACATASPAVLAATVIVVGALTPGYSQLADAVSHLASPGQRDAVAAQAGIVVYGLLVLAAATLFERPVARLVGVYGLASVVAGVAPKDATGAAHTVLSEVHVDATLVGGAALLAAMLLVARRGTTRGERRLAAAAFMVSASGAIAFALCWGSPVYGLVERLLLAAASLWIAVSARRWTRNEVFVPCERGTVGVRIHHTNATEVSTTWVSESVSS